MSAGTVMRPAVPDDVPALAVLEAALFGVDAWDERALLAEVEGPGRTFLVAVDDGRTTGYAVGIEVADIADLARIGVEPDQRRTGLGSRLLGALVDATTGADRMLLEVSAANTGAISFYERHGFTRIDVRPRYYADGSDAVVMLRPLGRPGERGEDGNHG